ncbi:MAG: DUF3782 domain-containing protein [Candidatus Nitrosocaldus sp.]
MQSKEELKKTLLDLLLEDKEFRHAVAGAIGYKEILDRFARVEEEIKELRRDMDTRFLKVEERIAKVEEEMNVRFLKVDEEIKALREETNNLRKDMNDLRRDMQEGFRRHDEEFARVWQSIEKLRQDMLEGFKRHDEELKRHWESIEKLRQDMLEGFRRHDEEFARVWKSIEDLRRDMQDGFKRLDLKVSALGARWGIMNEESVREALKGIVGKELGYTVQEWNTYDGEGYVYGYPSNVQLDIVSNGKIIAVEVASHVKRSDPLILKRKVELYRKREGRDVSRVMFVTPFIDDEAIDACNRFGIEVYST